jgi:phage baseplate assembly protein gpV
MSEEKNTSRHVDAHETGSERGDRVREFREGKAGEQGILLSPVGNPSSDPFLPQDGVPTVSGPAPSRDSGSPADSSAPSASQPPTESEGAG